MEKITLFAVALALLLIGGVIFTSAAIQQKDEIQESETKTDKQPQQTCGPETCNQECGGNCGIPSCGCGR